MLMATLSNALKQWSHQSINLLTNAWVHTVSSFTFSLMNLVGHMGSFFVHWLRLLCPYFSNIADIQSTIQSLGGNLLQAATKECKEATDVRKLAAMCQQHHFSAATFIGRQLQN